MPLKSINYYIINYHPPKSTMKILSLSTLMQPDLAAAAGPQRPALRAQRGEDLPGKRTERWGKPML
jgi:hypothetical protein